MASGPSADRLMSSNLGIIQMDDITKEFVDSCKKALSRYVGPMGRVYVKEEVLKLAQNGLFLQNQLPQLLKKLESLIDTEEEREQFRNALTNY